MKRHNKDLKCYKNSVAQVGTCEIFRLITNFGSTWDASGSLPFSNEDINQENLWYPEAKVKSM